MAEANVDRDRRVDQLLRDNPVLRDAVYRDQHPACNGKGEVTESDRLVCQTATAINDAYRVRYNDSLSIVASIEMALAALEAGEFPDDKWREWYRWHDAPMVYPDDVEWINYSYIVLPRAK